MNQQMAERRQRILSAARAIIAERGFEALTMRDLAAQARVTVPTIYNLIGGKDAVLFAAVEERTAEFLAGIETDDSGSAASRLLSVVESCNRELLRLPHYYQSLLRLLFTASSEHVVRADVYRTLGDQLRASLRSLAEAGELEPWVDVEALSEQLRQELVVCSMRWVSGELGPEGLRAAAIYGSCLLMLGVSRGEARREFEARAREVQGRARGRVGRRATATREVTL